LSRLADKTERNAGRGPFGGGGARQRGGGTLTVHALSLQLLVATLSVRHYWRRSLFPVATLLLLLASHRTPNPDQKTAEQLRCLQRKLLRRRPLVCPSRLIGPKSWPAAMLSRSAAEDPRPRRANSGPILDCCFFRAFPSTNPSRKASSCSFSQPCFTLVRSLCGYFENFGVVAEICRLKRQFC
jgi:hypothetical protein